MNFIITNKPKQFLKRKRLFKVYVFVKGKQNGCFLAVAKNVDHARTVVVSRLGFEVFKVEPFPALTLSVATVDHMVSVEKFLSQVQMGMIFRSTWGGYALI